MEPLPAAAALLVQLSGIAALLLAGRVEARGDLERSRALARRGGFAAAVGGAASVPLLLAAAAGWAALLAASSGFASLLAGLSGKPRPTGWGAAILHLAAWAAFVPLP